MSRLFTEQEIEEIADESSETFQTVKEEVIDQGDWQNHMSTVVREVSTGKLYSIWWMSALTENQIDSYYEGEYPEVFEIRTLEVEEQTRYLTAEQKDRFSASTTAEDIESIKVVGDTEKVEAALSAENAEKLRAALELLDSLAVLDPVSNFSNYRRASTHYFETLLENTQGEITDGKDS